MVMETEAVLRFRGRDDNLTTILEGLSSGFKDVGVHAKESVKQFHDINTHGGDYQKTLEEIGLKANRTAQELRTMQGATRSAYSSFISGAQTTMDVSDTLESRVVRLTSRFVGTKKATDALRFAIGPAADLFYEFADAGSNTERAFIGLNKTARPVGNAIGIIAQLVNKAATQVEGLGVVGAKASVGLGMFGARVDAIAAGLARLGLASDVYLKGGGALESIGGAFSVLGESAVPAMNLALEHGDPIIKEYTDKLSTFSGQLELAEEAARKFHESESRTARIISISISRIGLLAKVYKQLDLALTYMDTATLRWAEFNTALSTFQGLGLDTTAIEISTSILQMKTDLLFSAEAAEKFFQVSVTGFAKLQDQLAFNTTLSAGATAGIKDMGRAIQDLVNGPLQNQVTSLDATNALYNAMSAGLTELGEAQQFLSAGLKLSGATGADSAQTIELLAKVQQVYGLTAGQAAETAAKLNGVVENGITTFPRLTNGLSRTASVAKQSGVELNELLGSVAALTKTMSTDDAMTGYSSLLQSIAGQGEQSAAAIAELGIQFDVNSIKTKGLNASLQELYQASGGSTERLKRIIPDALAFQTALVLMTSAADDAVETTGKIGEMGGNSLDELFGNRRQSLIQQMTGLVNGFNETMIDFGDRFAPMIEPAITIMQDFLGQLQNLPGPIKQFIVSIVGVGFAVRKTTELAGGFVMTLGKMAKAYLTSRVLSLAMQGTLAKEISIIREMIQVQGNWGGAILRVFGVQDGMAQRIQEVTGLTRLQIRTNVEAAAAQQRINEVYSQFTAARGADAERLSAQLAKMTTPEHFAGLMNDSAQKFRETLNTMGAKPTSDFLKAVTQENLRLGRNIAQNQEAFRALERMQKKINALPDGQVRDQALIEMSQLRSQVEERRELLLDHERKIGAARIKQAQVNAEGLLKIEKQTMQQLQAFQEKINTADHVSPQDKARLTAQTDALKAQTVARQQALVAQQQELAIASRSTDGAVRNTAAKAANAKMTALTVARNTSAGKSVGFLDAMINKLTRTTAINSVGTRANARAVLTLQQATDAATASTNQISIAQAKNTISQKLNTTAMAIGAEMQTTYALSLVGVKTAANLVRGAFQALMIQAKELWKTLLPFAKVMIPLGILFGVLQDFIPLLGGMAKKNKELSDSFDETVKAVAALNNKIIKTADTQREMVVQQEDFNSNIARFYNFFFGMSNIVGNVLDFFWGGLKKIDDLTGNLLSKVLPLTRLFTYFAADIDVRGTEKQLKSLRSELDATTDSVRAEKIQEEIKTLEDALKENVTVATRMRSFFAQNAQNIDELLQKENLEQRQEVLRRLDNRFAESIKMREHLSRGFSATEEARAIQEKITAEGRVATAEEMKAIIESEKDAIEAQVKSSEAYIKQAEKELEAEKNPERAAVLESRIKQLREESAALNEAAKAMEEYRQNVNSLRARILDNNAETGIKNTQERLNQLRDELEQAFADSDMGEEGAQAAKQMFDSFTEGMNLSSVSQRRAAVKLSGTLKSFLETSTQTGVEELDPAAITASIERYYEAIGEAASAGTISSEQKASMFQSILDQSFDIQGLEGSILPPQLLQQVEQELIGSIKELSEKRIAEKEHEVGAIRNMELQGILDSVEAIEQRVAMESDILDERLQAQRETTEAIKELLGEESSEYKKALRELEVLERTSIEQRINAQKTLFDARMAEIQHETQIVLDAIHLSEIETNTNIRTLLSAGAISAIEADEMRLASAKEKNEQQIQGAAQMVEAIQAELAKLDEEDVGDSPRRLELEKQLRDAVRSRAQLVLESANQEAQANDIAAKKIEENAAIRNLAIEEEILGIQKRGDALQQENLLLQRRVDLIQSAAQLQQSVNALDNLGIEAEIQMLDVAVGLQQRLRDLRHHPEYHARAMELLDRIEQGGKNELELLKEKQSKEMELAQQRHEQLLVQQELDQEQLKLQLEMEKVRARAAIQEAEIAKLKALQSQIMAEAAVAAAMQRGDEAAVRQAQMQIQIAQRSSTLAEQQLGNAREAARITEQSGQRQLQLLENQQRLAREQSEEGLRQLGIQHEMEEIQAEVAAEERRLANIQAVRDAEMARLDAAQQMLATIEGQNKLLEIQRRSSETLRGIQLQALEMTAELERSPFRIRKAEQATARAKMEALREAQEMERRQLEMTLRREEIELRIAAIRNEAAQAQSQARIMQAEANLASTRASGASREEVAAAEAGLQAALAQGIATGMEGVGIREQLDILRESADMQREQLTAQQEMAVFQQRRENLSSLRPGQQRHQERVLRDEMRNFSRRMGRQARSASRDVRESVQESMEEILGAVRTGGLDALMAQGGALFQRSQGQRPRLNQAPPSPRASSSVASQMTQRGNDLGTSVGQVNLENHIEINLPSGTDPSHEMAEKLKQTVLNTMYDVVTEVRR